MVKTEFGISFALLLYVFHCRVSPHSSEAFALVRWYLPVAADKIPLGAQLTGFRSLVLAPAKDSCFLPLESVVRGALVVPTGDPTRRDSFLVNDLVDSEMYVRLGMK